MSKRLERVTPEMCTKDELCAYIRQCVGRFNCAGAVCLKQSLDSFVRQRRAAQICKDLSITQERLIKAERRYQDIRRAYPKYGDMPDDARKKENSAYFEYSKIKKEMENLTRKLEKI